MSSEKYRAVLDDIARNNALYEKPSKTHNLKETILRKADVHLNAAGEDDPDAPTESELQAEMTFKHHARGEEAPAEVEKEEEGGELHSMLGERGREMDSTEQHRRHKAAAKSLGKTSRELVTAGKTCKPPRKKPRSKATGRNHQASGAWWGVRSRWLGWRRLQASRRQQGPRGRRAQGVPKKRKWHRRAPDVGKPAAGEGRQKLAKEGSGKAVVGDNRKATAAITPLRPEKKPRRYKPGTLALREIRKYQKSTDFLIPKITFGRIVRRLCNTYSKQEDLRWQASALDALLEASQDSVVGLFGDAIEREAREAQEEKEKSEAASRAIRTAQGPSRGAEKSEGKDKGKRTTQGPEGGAKTEKLLEKRKETKAKQGPGVGVESAGERAELWWRERWRNPREAQRSRSGGPRGRRKQRRRMEERAAKPPERVNWRGEKRRRRPRPGRNYPRGIRKPERSAGGEHDRARKVQEERRKWLDWCVQQEPSANFRKGAKLYIAIASIDHKR
ncbi:histone H3 [Klebsormidium nitens]|uniref:Histone H3 n=1 Tax=Klebsormidium nitens TaxID=105231 RepID=A0A1Y1IR64_KLENI|nr:histone H3 [Klebsormidium nitens]|eukprot:GAQ91731.1 histone H3 [Klebsormidium nitens]